MQTVLVVDDSETDIALLRQIFRKVSNDYSLQCVRDGSEAIAYLGGEGKFAARERHPFPSLLILDMNLPGMSGEEVLQWIKGKPHLDKMFVVILTGAARRTQERTMFEQHGNVCIFNSHFLKPATQSSIEGMMNIFETWFRRVTAENPA